MKVAILGDLHIGASSNSKTIWANQYRFFQNQFLPYLEKNNIDLVVQTGDFFDNRSSIAHTAMHNGVWVASEIAKLAPLIVLVGNHDIPFKNTNDFDSVDPIIGMLDNVQVVAWTGHWKEITIVPWISPGNELQVMEEIAKTKAPYLFGHFDIIGGKFNKHDRKSEHGLEPATLKKFRRVISGHYHTRSQISNIHFVGTPYELDWNDWDDPKGFHVLDTETDELTFIENERNIFYKIIQADDGSTTTIPPKPPADSFAGCFVKIEANADDKAAARKLIDKVSDAANVQTILTKQREVVTIENVETKSVTQAILEAAQNCSRPEMVTQILSRAIEKTKTL